MTQCFTNGTVNLQYGLTKLRYNIRRINPYKSDAKVEDYNSINMSDDVSICRHLYNFIINIKFWKKVYNRMRTYALTVMPYWPCHEVL